MNQQYTLLLQLMLAFAAMLAPSCMQSAEDTCDAEKMFHKAFIIEATEQRYIGSNALFKSHDAIITAIVTELSYQQCALENLTSEMVGAAIESIMQRTIRMALEKSGNYLNIATFLYLKTKGRAFNLITTETLSNLYLPISCDEDELKIDLTRQFLVAETAYHPINQRLLKRTGIVSDEMQALRNLILSLNDAAQSLTEARLAAAESKEVITVTTQYDDMAHHIETTINELVAFYNKRLSLKYLIRVATILDEHGMLHLYLLHETADEAVITASCTELSERLAV